MDNEKDSRAIDAIARTCIAVRLRLLNRVVTNLYDDALRPLGLKVSQLNVLVVTAKLGVAQPAKVCDLLQLDTSTLSRNVERMCARGWLRLVQDADRRSHLIEVTDNGQALIRKCLPAWQKAQAEVSRRLGTKTITELRCALRKLSVRN